MQVISADKLRRKGTRSWEATVPVLFLPLLSVGPTLKEKNLLLKEQILSIKSRPLQKGVPPPLTHSPHPR